MKIKTITLIITGFILVISVSIVSYYYIPRIVPFKMVIKIQKPNKTFNRRCFVGFDYVNNEERLYYKLVDYYKKPSCIKSSLVGYDSLFVSNIIDSFDFEEYDYLIAYQKKLIDLKYSPYLTRTNDGLYHYRKEIPLIPSWDTTSIGVTDSIFIYKIKKPCKICRKYRSLGP